MALDQLAQAAPKGEQPTTVRVTRAAVLFVFAVATVGFGRLCSLAVRDAKGARSALSLKQKDASHWQNETYSTHPTGGTQMQASAAASYNSSARASATIVCQLEGGMGNNLEMYAHCLALSQLLLKDYQLSSRIVIRHAERMWRQVEKDLKSCFPVFRSLNFEEGNTHLFQKMKESQVTLLGENLTALLDTLFVSWRGQRFLDPNEVDSALKQFVNAFDAAHDITDVALNSTAVLRSNISGSVPISLPFLHVTWLASVDTYMDEMMQELRNLYAFDTSNESSQCCALLPEMDETVFHLRNYIVERPSSAHRLAYDELGPEQTARDLVGHLIPGEKVAILSRYSQESAQPYIDAMERRGLKVRYIAGQSGLQDFCFLRHAKKEMIGTAISTFFWWAAYLSDCSKVTASSVDTDRRRSRFGDHYLMYNFTNPLLAGRFFRPLIALDDSVERSGG